MVLPPKEKCPLILTKIRGICEIIRGVNGEKRPFWY